MKRDGSRLRDLIAQSSWMRRSEPFPHIVVKDVFIEAVYRQLVAAFVERLPQPARTERGIQRLTYHGDHFDGYLMPFTPSLRGPLSLFVSKAWLDLLASATGVRVTDDVNGALHCHPTGSSNGFIHEDFSSCWFAEQPRASGVNVSDSTLCNYRSGATASPDVIARERVRAVAMIFYLGNKAWAHGDGGETGLYRSRRAAVDKAEAIVPPVNNSMVLFECTPHSYHSFISNRRNPRCSIAMWLHQTKADAAKKWGESSILYVKQ